MNLEGSSDSTLTLIYILGGILVFLLIVLAVLVIYILRKFKRKYK